MLECNSGVWLSAWIIMLIGMLKYIKAIYLGNSIYCVVACKIYYIYVKKGIDLVV